VVLSRSSYDCYIIANCCLLNVKSARLAFCYISKRGNLQLFLLMCKNDMLHSFKRIPCCFQQPKAFPMFCSNISLPNTY
jgi:hypothetical protein